MIEQQFVRQYPEKVSNLVLINTLVPNSYTVKKFGRYAAIDLLMPSFIYSKIWKAAISKIIKNYLDVSQEEQNFWINHYANSFSKERGINRTKIVTDFLKNYNFIPDDLKNWSGSVMIIESEKDPIMGKNEFREHIRIVYPNARFYKFNEGNAVTNEIFKSKTIVSLIEDFLSTHKF